MALPTVSESGLLCPVTYILPSNWPSPSKSLLFSMIFLSCSALYVLDSATLPKKNPPVPIVTATKTNSSTLYIFLFFVITPAPLHRKPCGHLSLSHPHGFLLPITVFIPLQDFFQTGQQFPAAFRRKVLCIS